MLRSLLNSMRHGPKTNRAPRRKLPLALEALEDRQMPSIVPLSSPIDAATGYRGGQDVQSHRAVAEDAAGNYRVVYQDYFNGVSGLYTRLFNSKGTPLGAPTLVPNSSRSDSQATVAMNDSGAGAFAWTHDAGNGASFVVVQRFDTHGALVGGPVWYHGSTNHASDPAVAIDAAGDYAVAFSDASGTARHVRGAYATGNVLGTPFSVSDNGHNTYLPSVAMNASGSFVVGYTYDYSATDQDVYAQRFNRGGAANGAAIAVAGSSHLENQASVAIDDAGDFVVAYTYVRSTSKVDNGAFGSFTDYQTEVWADLYSAAGTHITRNVVASSPSQTASAYAPSAAMSGTGDYIIGYTTGSSYGPYNPADGWSTVRAAAYNHTGALMDGGITLSSTPNPTANHRDSLPSVAMSRAGHLVAAWQNYGTKYVGDLPGDGVFTQTFVDEPFRYSLPGGSDVIVLGGMPTTLKVDLTRDAGSSAPLTIGVANLPPGVTYTVSPPAAGAPRTEERTITFNAPNNVAAAYNFAAQLQLSTPGYSTLTPGMNFTVTPSYIGSVLGPNSDHTKFLKGLPLTIQGAGFVPGSKVQFGSSGALVTPTSIASNGTSLTVSVPMTAPNGPLTIVRPGGSSLVSASVTYSAPAITLVEQKEGWAHENVSAGTVVRIDGYGFLPGTKVQFGDPDHLDATAEVGALAVDPGGNWLTVEVPTLAVNGAVSVIVPTGSAATTLRSVDTFTVRNYRDTFGFAFHNFTFNVSFPLVSDTFGAAQTHVTVWNPFGDDVVTPVPTPGALAFTAAAAIGINGNGACFGICVTTLDLQRNYDLYRTDVGLPAGALPEPHNLVRDGGLTNYIERRHLTQLSQQVIDSVLKWAAAPHATNDVYNQVRGMILNHDNPILSIHNSLTDGHCVVGYDVLNEVRDASGKVTAFDIDVYDPNRECAAGEMTDLGTHKSMAQGSRIHVANGRWSFTMAGGDNWSGDLGSMIPLSDTQVPSKPTLPSLTDTLTHFVFNDAGRATSGRAALANAVFSAPAPHAFGAAPRPAAAAEKTAAVATPDAALRTTTVSHDALAELARAFIHQPKHTGADVFADAEPAWQA